VKRNVPLAITALVGFVLMLAPFIPYITTLNDTALLWFDVIGGFGAILGAASLLRMHYDKVRRQVPGWFYSGVAIVAFLGSLLMGVFAIGAPRWAGLHAYARGATPVVVDASIADRAGARRLQVTVVDGPANTTHPILLNETQVGEITLNERGRGDFALVCPDDVPAVDPAHTALKALYVPLPVRPPDAPPAPPFEPVPLAIGDLVSTQLGLYAPLTRDYRWNGGAFWYTYEYFLNPLSQTMFATLAFYVASAAFRAFRARNTESVLLLSTAFIILLGQTFAGAWLTDALPEEGGWAFFRIENLKNWIMLIFATAGNRAIMIGVALGIAATSLKILLGVDRSYLGSDKG
jgi:hypothetical protein